MKTLCVLMLLLLTSCATVPEDNHAFEFSFGVADKRYHINPTNKIVWKKGVIETPYGVYIRRIKPIEYKLSFAVSRYDSTSKKKIFIEKCGIWRIGPPINKDYSAVITHVFDNEVEYGEYIFDVYVDNKLTKSFVYQVVPPDAAALK